MKKATEKSVASCILAERGSVCVEFICAHQNSHDIAKTLVDIGFYEGARSFIGAEHQVNSAIITPLFDSQFDS